MEVVVCTRLRLWAPDAREVITVRHIVKQEPEQFEICNLQSMRFLIRCLAGRHLPNENA